MAVSRGRPASAAVREPKDNGAVAPEEPPISVRQRRAGSALDETQISAAEFRT